MDKKTVFQEIEDIGVIWVLDEAVKLGYYNGNPDWANLGQGEPEIGEIQGAPPRISHFDIEPDDDRYGPINGTDALREAIANYYNHLYRQGKTSQYTLRNVSIAMGGRLALTRLLTIFEHTTLGYKTPEYPAYKDMLKFHKAHINSVCIPTKKENNYSIPSNEIADEIKKHKLDAFLFSNPCNPAGHVIKGKELQQYVLTANEQNCVLIIDEVYSHFIYDGDKPASKPVSSAAFIEEVNADPVFIVDAITKSFRYPGWRLAWIVGPEDVIETLGRAASSIDGGPSVPIQRAALPLFEKNRVQKETNALRSVFSRKHNITLATLRACGMICSDDAKSTFYVWADISKLPNPLNNADVFFREAMNRKVITVPGYMFDIHPDRQNKKAKFNQYIRLSFGPSEENLQMGLKRIEELIQSYQ